MPSLIIQVDEQSFANSLEYYKIGMAPLDSLAAIIFISIIVTVSPSSAQRRRGSSLQDIVVEPTGITLSGFSSGGTFAQQLQVSYSSLFHGIASFSHAFFRCGPGDGIVERYDRLCTNLFNLTEDELYDVNRVHEDIARYEKNKLIDPTVNLRNKRLYVYAGLRNILFYTSQQLKVVSVYEPYIKNIGSIATRVQDANLVLPTRNNFGAKCTENAMDRAFIGNCRLNGPLEALRFILQDVKRIKPPVRKQKLQALKKFDQREFTKNVGRNHHLDSHGFYYVPRRCRKRTRKNKCLMHFYFHGCLTGREFVEDTHIKESGLLELAERNDIVMIFPQTVSSLPQNEIGCWDTFGIGGPLYATQKGPQVRAVKNMIDKILNNSPISFSRTQ